MIARLVGFCDIELTEELAALVEQMTTREFMFEHKDRFDDAIVCAAFDARLGIPADSDSTKVQAAGSDPTQVAPAIAEKIDAMWAEQVEPVTGHKNFASLAAEIDRQGSE